MGKIIIICAVVLFLIAYLHFTQVGPLFDDTVKIRDRVQSLTDPIIKSTLQKIAEGNVTKH